MGKPNYVDQTQELVEKTEKVPKRAKNDHVDWEKLARLSALIPVPDPKPYISIYEPTWVLKKRLKDKY